MSCSCGNITCNCKILCNCLKESCDCKKCSTLMNHLCNICGLPFDSADQFSKVKSKNVCSCFLHESTLYNETELPSKPANTLLYIPVPVFYPLPLMPNHQLLSRIENLPNARKEFITNQPLPRSIEFRVPSTSIESSNNATCDHSVVLKDSDPVLNSQQLPRDVYGEKNISLQVEERKENSGSSLSEELDKDSNPDERPHESTLFENDNQLMEQFKMAIDLWKSVSKNCCGTNENPSTNSTIHLIDPERPDKVNMPSPQFVSIKSERQNSSIVAPLKDATQTDPPVGNRLARLKMMKQNKVQSVALKNRPSRNVINRAHCVTLVNQPNNIHSVFLENQPDRGSQVISKAPISKSSPVIALPTQPKVTEVCSNLGSSAINDKPNINVIETSCINQHRPISLWYETWHPEPCNKSSLEPIKRLVNKTFKYKKLTDPDSKQTHDLKYKEKNFQSAKWAHYTKEWLDSLPPAFP